MRYGKPTLRDSFFGWLGTAAHSIGPDANERTMRIRKRMLDELLRGPSGGASELPRRILRAPDAQALWHCRGELMQALSTSLGEAAAMAVLAEVTRMFAGLVPARLLGAARVRRR